MSISGITDSALVTNRDISELTCFKKLMTHNKLGSTKGYCTLSMSIMLKFIEIASSFLFFIG